MNTKRIIFIASFSFLTSFIINVSFGLTIGFYAMVPVAILSIVLSRVLIKD